MLESNILTVQRPDCTILDSFIKSNINNRIVLKCMDSKNSIVALDTEGAELLNKGEALIRVSSDLVKYKSYYIDESKLKMLLEPYRRPKENKAPKLEPSNKTSVSIADTTDDNEIDLSFLDEL